MTETEHAIRVEVSADRMTATLVIEPGVQRQAITPTFRDALLEQAGLRGDHDVVRAFDALLAKPSEPGRRMCGVIAQGVKPEDGTDGRVDWHVGSAAQDKKEKDQSGRVNFYDMSAFELVEVGQRVGRITSPTRGKPGVDVAGNVLPARDGKPATLKTDESILVQADGTLVAQRKGILSVSRNKASIHNCLRVENNVDFSTGNINFDGDVVVGRDVRDRFVVKATGNVVVNGLIEAATLDAGGDLEARGGFAGRTRGSANVGGDMVARYLNEVTAVVLGDLRVEREVINCELRVDGQLLMPHGSVIGGRIVVGGVSTIKNVGSVGGVRTTLCLGSVPRFEPMARRLVEIIDALEVERLARADERTRLKGNSQFRKLTPAEWERIEQLAGRVETLDLRLVDARKGLATLEARIERLRTIDLTITGRLYPGVEVHTPDAVFEVLTDVAGPIRIFQDAAGSLVYTTPHGRRGLLGQITQTRLAA